MSDPFVDKPIPKKALWAGAAMVGLSLIGASLGAATREHRPPPAAGLDAVETRAREVVFVSGEGGALLAMTTQGARIAALDPNDDGFIHQIVKVVKTDRQGWDAPSETLLRIARWSDGRLTLEDSVTGRSYELVAFGRTNAAAFSRLVDMPADVAGVTAEDGRAPGSP